MATHRFFIRVISALALMIPSLFLDAGGLAQVWAAPAGQWVSIGPSRITAPPTQGLGQYDAVGRLTTIAVNPVNPQIIYAASAGQLGHEGSGVWKTTNGGGAWIPISDNLPTLSIGAIAIDPSNPDRVYVVAVDEGLFRSDDAGVLWTPVHGDLRIRTNTDTGDWAALLINPVTPNVMYVTSDLGIQRSLDGGQTWSVSLNPGDPALPETNHATSLVMDPLNPDLLYAAIRGKGIYKTVNGSALGGATWTQQTQSPLPFDNIETARGVLLAISHPASAAAETVYAIVPRWQGWVAYDLYRTTDGTSWSKQSTTCATVSNCFVTILAADPVDTKRVYVGGGPFWVSADGGVNLDLVPPAENDRQPASPHGDYWELVVDPINPAILYAGTDGGIYKSSNHGLTGTWSFIGEGITNAEMYDLALATPVNRAISGTQDSGNIRYSGNLVWDHMPGDKYTAPNGNFDFGIQGGDGAGVAIDPTDANRFYAVFDNRGTPAASLDGGVTFNAFTSGISNTDGCGIWNMTFHIQTHPANPQVLLESCRSLWRTTTTAGPPASWNWIPIFAPANQLVNRSAVESSLDIYYAGTDSGHVFAGPGGAGWQEVFAHPNSLYVSDLEVDPLNPDTLYASFAPKTRVDRNCAASASAGRVYQLRRVSPNLPNLAMTAVDITGNLLPGLCVNALAIDPVVQRTVYAGTNKGVYRGRTSSTGGPWVWELYSDGMPRADVRDLEVHAVTGHIFAATFGRSAFEVAPETNSPPELTVPGPQSVDYHDPLTFVVSATDVDAGDTLSFSASGLPAGLTLTDNGNRTATVSGTVTAVPNVYTATIAVQDGTNLPVSATVQITVTKEQTTTQYTGPLVIANTLPVTLAGKLLEDGVTPIAGRTLTLSVGSQSCNGTTSASGDASCLISTVSLPLGPVTVKAEFAGDLFYLPSSKSATAIVFAFPARGDFVLGDSTVAKAGPTTTLTYWGAQWRSLNAVTSGVPLPSFKGFAATPSSTPSACGATWNTGPGNSSDPVATVPAYMGVAVASTVTKSGSTISGNIVRIVVIKTNDGYAPDPGHAGTGTLVAIYCSLP